MTDWMDLAACKGMDDPCRVCGPQDPPTVHVVCHPVRGLRFSGCGHSLDDHTDTLICRVCKQNCGVWCRL